MEYIKEHEGFRNKTYKDTLGKLTGGVGHLLTEDEQALYPLGTLIPDNVIDDWLTNDLKKADAAAQQQAAELGICNPDFLRVLTSVNFQLGSRWHKKFPTAFRHLKNKEYERAKQEILFTKEGSGVKSDWNKQTPRRVADFVAAIDALK